MTVPDLNEKTSAAVNAWAGRAASGIIVAVALYFGKQYNEMLIAHSNSLAAIETKVDSLVAGQQRFWSALSVDQQKIADVVNVDTMLKTEEDALRDELRRHEAEDASETERRDRRH